jgi:hypothetical protein
MLKILALALWVFLKEDFLSLNYIHKGKNNDPLWRCQFFQQGFYLNKLGRHPLEDEAECTGDVHNKAWF